VYGKVNRRACAVRPGLRLALVTHIDNQSHFVIMLFSGATDVRGGDLTNYKPTMSPCTLRAPGGGSGADPMHSDLPGFKSVSLPGRQVDRVQLQRRVLIAARPPRRRSGAFSLVSPKRRSPAPSTTGNTIRRT
jgi:hypothetical protein